MLEIHEIPVTPFVQNCTLWVCSESGRAVVCDCGEAGPVLARVAELGVEVEAIVATHGHLDHIAGTAELQQALGVPFHFPPEDDFWRLGLQQQAQTFGMPAPEIPQPDAALEHGMEFQLGEHRLEVRHCPGHTPGHVVFFHAAGEQLVAGDVIFQGSIGRTDFPRGSFPQLERSIREQVYTLPGPTRIHCGHGPTTTVGHESATNPFVRPA